MDNMWIGKNELRSLSVFQLPTGLREPKFPAGLRRRIDIYDIDLVVDGLPNISEKVKPINRFQKVEQVDTLAFADEAKTFLRVIPKTRFLPYPYRLVPVACAPIANLPRSEFRSRTPRTGILQSRRPNPVSQSTRADQETHAKTHATKGPEAYSR
jgi:hypothetical protein